MSEENVRKIVELLGVHPSTAKQIVDRYAGDLKKAALDFTECASVEDFLKKLGIEVARRLPTPRNKDKPVVAGHSAAATEEEEEMLLKIAMAQSLVLSGHEDAMRTQIDKVVKAGEDISRLEKEKDALKAEMDRQRAEALDMVIAEERAKNQNVWEVPKFSDKFKASLGATDHKGTTIAEGMAALEEKMSTLKKNLLEARKGSGTPSEIKGMMDAMDKTREEYLNMESEALTHISELERNETVDAAVVGPLRAVLEKDVTGHQDHLKDKEVMDAAYAEQLAEYQKAAAEMENKVTELVAEKARVSAQLHAEVNENARLIKDKLIRDCDDEANKKEAALNKTKLEQQAKFKERLAQRKKAT